MSFPRYPIYKASGVEWLKEVPEHWGAWKLTHAVERIGSGTTPKTDNREYYDEGTYPWVNTGDLNDGDLNTCEKKITCLALSDHPTLRIYPVGSVVIAMYGATIGKLAILRFEATVNQACCVFAGKSKLESKFLFYWLLGFRKQIISLASGGGQPNVNQDVLRTLRVACPESNEQMAITEFLDRETGKIDELVAEQRRLMELLKEKRQAIISHAVTKGLNPNAPMKPSGVDWIGDVPEHWTVCSLKHYVSTINGFGFSSADFREEGVPLIRAGNIKNKSITQPTIFLPEEVVEKYQRILLATGDIVISMVGSDPEILESAVGQVGIVPDSVNGAVPNQNVVILREDRSTLLSRYLFYTVCSSAYRNHLNLFSHKLANQSIISSSLLVCAKFTFPELEEQEQIIEFLKLELAKFDTLTAEAQRAIDLLQERRTALISAAVTGQIDVRKPPKS
jgi:type I restriction enzyme S subunit